MSSWKAAYPDVWPQVEATRPPLSPPKPGKSPLWTHFSQSNSDFSSRAGRSHLENLAAQPYSDSSSQQYHQGQKQGQGGAAAEGRRGR